MLRHKLLGPTPWVSDSVVLEWGRPNRFPSTIAAALETNFDKHWPSERVFVDVHTHALSWWPLVGLRPAYKGYLHDPESKNLLCSKHLSCLTPVLALRKGNQHHPLNPGASVSEHTPLALHQDGRPLTACSWVSGHAPACWAQLPPWPTGSALCRAGG